MPAQSLLPDNPYRRPASRLHSLAATRDSDIAIGQKREVSAASIEVAATAACTRESGRGCLVRRDTRFGTDAAARPVESRQPP